MSLSASTPQLKLTAFIALLFGSPCAITERPRLETRLRQAQDTKGKGSLASAAVPGASARADALLGRVLVVDDEVLVRQMLSLFLAKAGFAATAVGSGEEALDLLRAGKTYDLLVTDQSMPGMTGRELVDEVARLCLGLPALVVTGYDMVGGLDQMPGGVPVLRKPVEREVFVRQVRALLGLAEN